MDRPTPIRITTQNQAREAREAIDFCYICGRKLPLRRSPAWKENVTADHVVPGAILGSGWPVILDVHDGCNDRKNKVGDEAAALMHKIRTTDPSTWPGQIRSSGLKPGYALDPRTGGLRPAMRGIAPVYHGAQFWARGMYTLLYQLFYPELLGGIILAPAPEERAPGPSILTGRMSNKGASLEETTKYKSQLLTGLAAACDLDRYDAVWSESLQFICVWMKERHRVTHGRVCLWSLAFGGLEKYAHKTGWLATPWLGMFGTPRAPRKRQTVAGDDVTRYQRRLHEATGSTLISLRGPEATPIA